MRVASGLDQQHGERAPDTGNQVDRDGADHVVDLQLVEHRHREDHDHATDGTDDGRLDQATGSAARR